jgi:hypothetical protein
MKNKMVWNAIFYATLAFLIALSDRLADITELKWDVTDFRSLLLIPLIQAANTLKAYVSTTVAERADEKEAIRKEANP